MSESFRDVMTAALTEQAGDTASDERATPEPQVYDGATAVPTAPSPEPQTSPGDTEPTTPAEEMDLRSYLEGRKAARPELAEEIDAIHREFQRGLTPKLQEAAELRKRFEGVDPADLDFIRQVNELAAISPQAAAQLLDQAKQGLLGYQQPQSFEQPYAPQPPQADQWEYANENEQRLHRELQELRTWQQQQMVAATRAEIDRQFTDIGREMGQEVPYEQRQAAARYCLQHNIPPAQIGVVWKGLHGVTLAQRRGRDEAAAVVERKTAMTPGPSPITPPPPAPPSQPSTLRGVLHAAFGVEES